MAGTTDSRRTSLEFPEYIWNMVGTITRLTGQSRSAVIRMSILLLNYMLGKSAEGFELQLKNRETGEVVVFPMALIVPVVAVESRAMNGAAAPVPPEPVEDVGEWIESEAEIAEAAAEMRA